MPTSVLPGEGLAPNKQEAVAIAKSGNEFAADLYAKLRLAEGTNLFFSPYSISLALAMTDAGAAGQTKAQIGKVLHLPSSGPSVDSGFGSLRKLLAPGGENRGFELRIANRLWGQKGFSFHPEFLSVLKNNYGAELGQLDFRKSEDARQTINGWIARQTDDKIRDLLPSGVLNADTRLVLTNAIYFKARWWDEFKESGTADADFHLLDDRSKESKKITVPMMRQAGHFNYAAFEKVQVLELPYVRGNISMIVLLPKHSTGLLDLEEKLTATNLQTWTADLREDRVEVHLPKFKLTSEFSLGDVLESMGMLLPFSRDADFSKMSSQEQLSISAVIHKAFVDVNEEGTEAAAATAIAVAAAEKVGQRSRSSSCADHPFVFLIRDNRTQSILFLGRLMNPGN